MPFKSEQSLKVVFKTLFSQYRKENGVSSTQVQAIYRQAMGAYIANHTTRIFLKHHILYLYIDIPSLRHELSLGKSTLLHILNEAIGEEQINDIKFH
jgi:hypothetical protein